MVRHSAATVLTLLWVVTPIAGAQASDIPPAAAVVLEEALRAQNDPSGRPLPLIAHWHRQSLPLSLQIELIKDGHPILPWIDYHRSRATTAADAGALSTLRSWKLPLTLLTGGQWEEEFYKSADFAGLPIEKTGLADDSLGNPIKKVGPLSPIEPWRVLGRMWTNNATAAALQSAYPDPPMVLFISNNEAQRLRWNETETSKSYVDAYGLGRSDDFKRKIVGDGWIDRYGAMFQGMRDGLTQAAWRNNSRFVGYSAGTYAFGPINWGRWDDWKKYSLVTEDRISPEWYSWNGAIVEAYDNDWQPDKTAFRIWSMQTELMNMVFMKEEALKVQPNFWFEAIFWDGDQPTGSGDKPDQYATMGIAYNPQFYSGWVQYSMWLLVPRVAREFRHSTDDRSRWWPYFEQIMTAVERVHTDPELRKFWRSGTLVPNATRTHPFNNIIPAKWANEGVYPRWFQLQTSVDPPLPVTIRPGDHYMIQLPVWNLARVIGTKPNREWLVYAHAPLGEKTNVRVTVPTYGEVNLPTIKVQGSFYHVVEATGKVTEVGLISAPLKKPASPFGIRTD